jgi:hypothetical protein
LDQNKWHQLVSERWLKGSKIDIDYQIGEGKFRFIEAVLIRNNFKICITQNIQNLKDSDDGM